MRESAGLKPRKGLIKFGSKEMIDFETCPQPMSCDESRTSRFVFHHFEFTRCEEGRQVDFRPTFTFS